MHKLLVTLVCCLWAYSVPIWADEPVTRWLAIWPIDSFAYGGGINSEELQVVQEIVPDLLSSGLAASSRVRLVERRKLLEVLNEQKLGASELADESTRLRLGRILGARYMLFGSYLKLGPSWQIDLRLVDSESGHILTSVAADQQQGDLLTATPFLANKLRVYLECGSPQAGEALPALCADVAHVGPR